jgi:Outer membrane protein beta-barrel domain
VARYLFCVLAVLLFAGFSAAQSSDHVEVFGGYSYMNPDFTSTVSNGASGWDVSATVNVMRHAGIVADFSGFSPTGANAGNVSPASAAYHTFLGGPQASIRMGRIKPFARFLMGATRGSLTHPGNQFGGDFSHFTYGAGGGVDLELDRWFALRGQVDWLHVGSQGNVARVSAGLVFRF